MGSSINDTELYEIEKSLFKTKQKYPNIFNIFNIIILIIIVIFIYIFYN